MKRILLILSFVAIGFTMNAQDEPQTERYPYWTISKGVQQIQFKNKKYVPATAVTGDNAIVYSKGVHKVSKQESTVTGRVQTGGTPSWVVSKGVARVQMSK